MNWIRRRMNAPAKKWSMNEAWLGARISGPPGTFSDPMPARAEGDQRVQDGEHPDDLVDLGLGLAGADALVEGLEVLRRARSSR